MRYLGSVLGLVLASSVVLMAAVPAVSAVAIRLPDGKPLVGIYYFPHWWEPWKSSDTRVVTDLLRLKSMGYNTIFVDHQWSQMLDGNWALIDRGHALATRAGVSILPWLASHVWSVGLPGPLYNKVTEMYGLVLESGVDQDGKPNGVKPYDAALMDYAVRYCDDYLARYGKDGAILRVVQDGKLRTVVGLAVEVSWEGSCDAVTQQMLRLWLKARHLNSTSRLNRSWGTSYAGFEEIDIRDKTVFDLAGYVKGTAKHPNAVDEYVEFRSQVIANSLAEIKRRIQRKHPEVIVAVEIPYQLDGEHPHAKAHRVFYGLNASAVKDADILVIRASDSLSVREQQALLRYRKQTKQAVVLTYRMSSSYWGPKLAQDRAGQAAAMSSMFASQAGKLAEGFGVYSWNEMVDPHIVPDASPGASVSETATRDYELTLDVLPRMADVFTAAKSAK